MEKILLITEDENIGQLIARFVQILLPEAQVHTERDGLIALNGASLEQPDFVILDSQLQQIPSYVVAKLFRQDESTKSIPIIGTGPEPKDKAARRLSKLTDAWIAKPTPIWALSQAIENVMQGSKPELWAPAPKNWLRLPRRKSNQTLSLVS